MGGRLLGARLSSFVGLAEVLFATILAALLVAQLPAIGQMVGAVLVLAGVILVKLGRVLLPRASPMPRNSARRQCLGPGGHAGQGPSSKNRNLRSSELAPLPGFAYWRRRLSELKPA